MSPSSPDPLTDFGTRTKAGAALLDSLDLRDDPAVIKALAMVLAIEDEAAALPSAPDPDLECLECGGRIGPRRLPSAPDHRLREALATALADALTIDWPGDTRLTTAPAIADYLLKRPEVAAALSVAPGRLVALELVADAALKVVVLPPHIEAYSTEDRRRIWTNDLSDALNALP